MWEFMFKNISSLRNNPYAVRKKIGKAWEFYLVNCQMGGEENDVKKNKVR